MDEQKNMKKNSSFEEQMLLNPKLFKALNADQIIKLLETERRLF